MNSETHNKFHQIKEVIENSRRILIAGHINTDGDALGSMLALHHAISENTNAKTLPYLTEEVPPSLTFLAKGESFVSSLDERPDLIIGVDYGDFERLNIPEDKIRGARMITFDHHEVHKQRGHINIIDTGYSSTCEMVYQFLKAVKWSISSKTALSIATGIMTDTGAFAHQTFPNTLITAGELLEMGTPLNDVYQNTFMKPVHVMNAWGDILSEASLDEDLSLAYAHVPFKKFEQHGIVLDDLEGLKDILKHVQEASFALLLMEPEHGKIKGSLRSTRSKGINVFEIADRLGGGGHKYAAAFKFEGSTLPDAHEAVKKAAKEALSAKATPLDMSA